MLLAIPVWQGRVSPVFDVAEQLLLVELDGSHELSRRRESLANEEPALRARRVADLGVDTLICGAISQPLESLLTAEQIEVVPWMCGDAEEILQAFRAGGLADGRFVMPGCCARRGGARARHRRGRCRREGRFDL
jgi:predicted Fe-Mo cluster-binding NifX family protein